MTKSNQSSLDIADHLSRGEYDWCPEAETRLREQHDLIRQQQAEIEALKAGKIRAYDNGYEDARKHDTNNEPVAWMCPTGLEYKQRATDFMYNDALYDTKLNWIPLYTHPVKELTDEEIEKIYNEILIHDKKSSIKFARAILRKAQEK